MNEVRRGLWHWQAPHPEWKPTDWWPQLVSSYAIDDGERLLLIDPVGVPDALLERAEEREPVVVLTVPWHERDARSLVERPRAAVWTPPPDSVEDLMQKFGVTRERAEGAERDLTWLVAGEAGEAHWYAAGDRLPGGIEAFLGKEPNDLVLWVEPLEAVIAGDTLVDFGQGFEINTRLRGGVTRDEVVERLRPLLALPVEYVLPTHGAPTDRAALVRALA